MSALLPVYPGDLTIVEGRGTRLFDDQGNSYLDLVAGLGVNGLGYGDRAVVAAIRKQAGRLLHASNLYLSESAGTLAERLVSLTFPAKVFFCNSGTESVEAAIKFARKIGGAEGRTELLAFEGAFHGRTLGSLSLTANPKYRDPFAPLVPGVHFCRFNDLEAAASLIGPKTAAVFLETVQGEGGVFPATAAFALGLSRLCRERGALLVADEVQCGLGRTGRLFAYQHLGFTPDVLTLAKPLGGGLPLGAVLVREDRCAAIAVGDHGSTFGGNPVAVAAALAVLERISSEALLQNVERRGAQLRKGLARLARKHPKRVAEVRGLGLMWGMELREEAGPILTELRQRGILATKAGPNVLRVLPPLIIRAAEIRTFLLALDEILGAGSSSL
jgi:predicted acetylornithine/succinylornithine family transaminase